MEPSRFGGFMRRFEYKDAKSHKFWEIELEGDAYTVRYGKVGTDGQVQTKTFAASGQAGAAAEKVIKSKVKKGYKEVVLDAKAKAAAKAKTSGGARNPELEAAILDAPAELDAWQVYADWLEGEGDPWGQRISLSVQRSQAKGAAKTKLTKQIAAYDKQHREALYGKSFAKLLAKKDFEQVAQIDAPHGMILAATVRSPEYDWSGTVPNTVLAALVKSPAARLLRALNIGMIDHEYPVTLEKAIASITKAGKLESLRELFIGDFEYPDESEISWVDVGSIAKVLPVVPKLRALTVRGAAIGLGKLEHDTLESLTIETGGLPRQAVASLGKCRLPKLRRMEVWFGRDEYGGNGNVGQLKGLFAGTGLPALEHLGLRNCEFADDLAAALAKSKILPRVRSVDLSMGTLHGPGAEAIVKNAAKFQHLESLDLDENYIPDDHCARLSEALGKIVNIGSQEAPDDWGDGELHYYTSVGE
jgi:uncharacterized protein (TIGR02996 family)